MADSVKEDTSAARRRTGLASLLQRQAGDQPQDSSQLDVTEPQAGEADSAPAVPADEARAERIQRGSRLAAHLVAWLPFLGFALLWSTWHPVGDGTAIAVRTWDVLTAHGPFVGQATMLAQGVFDPGPMEYWLLALPVHVDPPHGLLWGAALWCMLAASATVEAAWSVARAAGALTASAVVVVATIWIPGLVFEPYWNPWFGAMFLFAALAAGLAVLCGKRGWWPVLVIAASVAAQCHLMYAVVSVALVVVAGVVALVDSIRTRSGYRWVLIGVVAGAFCWTAPLIQEFTVRAGNLTALLQAQGASGPRTGWVFAFKALAGGAQPPPLWWTPLRLLLNLHVIGQRSPAGGVVCLIVLAAALIVAIRPLRSRTLAALAGIALVLCVASLVTYARITLASFPAHPSEFSSLDYLLTPLLPIGVLTWLTVVSVAVAAVRKYRHAGVQARAARPMAAATWWTRPAAGLAAIAILAAASTLTVVAHAQLRPRASDVQVERVIESVYQQIHHRLRRQPFKLSVLTPNDHFNRRMLLGLAWVFTTHGYNVRMNGPGWQLGPTFQFHHGMPIARVRVMSSGTGSGLTVKITSKKRVRRMDGAASSS